MRTIGMSDYTVGEDCFDELPGSLAEFGATKVAIIGGKRALAAALPGIEAALAGTDVEILETRVYGTNSTRANIAKVVNSPLASRQTCLSPVAAARHSTPSRRRPSSSRRSSLRCRRSAPTARPRPPLPLSTTTTARSRAIRTPTDRRISSSIPRSSPRLRRSTSGPAWAMPCQSSPRSSTPRAPVIWSTPPVLAWHSPTPAPSRCLPMACRV